MRPEIEAIFNNIQASLDRLLIGCIALLVLSTFALGVYVGHWLTLRELGVKR